jgi:RNA polymerase sigma-70 factor (ECF subfamily)
MTTDEETLLVRLRQKDSDALARWIALVRPKLLGYVERRLGPALRRKLEPDDVVQEASAEAVRALPEVDLGDRDPFLWLCQIAERRIIDAHRHFYGTKKRDAAREVGLGAGGDSQRVAVIDLLVASMTTPSEAFSRGAREARLLDAINQLPEIQRTALRLRYVEGLPSKQIAEQLDKSDAAIRVMLTRSVKKLETLLSDVPH